MQIYSVRASSQITTLLEKNAGTRRRSVRLEDGSTLQLTFGRDPVYLDQLPAEIERDTHLVVKPVTKAEMAAAGGKLTPLLKAERIQGASKVGSKPSSTPSSTTSRTAKSRKPSKGSTSKRARQPKTQLKTERIQGDAPAASTSTSTSTSKG